MALSNVLSEMARRISRIERWMETQEAREPSNSSCIVSRAAAQTIAHNTVTAIEFPTEEQDTEDLHSTTVNTSRITIKVPGVYLVTGGLRIAANATGRRILRVLLNGETVAPAHEHPASNEINRISVIVVAVCATAGDYLEMAFQQTSGGNLDIDIARFAATRIA